MSERLKLAVEHGHVVLPEGNVFVLEPRADSDLSVFDHERTVIHSTRASIGSALFHQGWADPDTVADWAATVVFLPREKAAQRALVRFAREIAPLAPIIIDGGKSDGVEALFRDLKDRSDVSLPWSKSHGKIFTVTGGSFEDWPEFGATQADDGWWRAPGVFSADGVDPASQLLVDTLPDDLKGHVVDLGAGWGFLSSHVVKSEAVTHIDLVEDYALAMSAAAWNVTDIRARLHHADALTWSPDTPVDHVVTNPPFHIGRAADPSLGQGFIRTAARILNRNGTLWLVANRQLPYEQTLNETFRDVHLLKETAQFKLYKADKPRARRKG